MDDFLTNPESLSEHVAANMGMSKMLGETFGADLKPTHSPFNDIGKDGKESAVEKAVKMGNSSYKTIKNDADSLFGYSSPKSEKLDLTNGKEFHPLYDQIDKLGIDPNLFVDHLGKQLAPISEHMPDVGIGLSKTASNAAMVLNSLKPDMTQKAPLDKKREATSNEIAKFNEAANLINNPVSILQKVKDGSLLSRHVNMLQSVYPNLLEHIQKETMSSLMKNQGDEKGPLSSSMRIGLSKLFNQNMDSSQGNLLANQIALAGISQAKQAQQAQTTKPSKAGMGKMQIGQRDETAAQASQQRVRK